MTQRISQLILTLTVLVASVWAPQLNAKDHLDDIYDMSLDENLMTPEIKNDKQADRIQEFQYNMAVAFKKSNYEVEVMRDDEVIVITIPASQLFDPNDTVLNKLGQEQLKPFLRMLKNPGFYKMLLVMHSDNTGSETYTYELSRARVNAVYDWFDANGDVDFVVPYALGDTDPIVDNNSYDNRARNRRLEIYLVPAELMIERAKKGDIKK